MADHRPDAYFEDDTLIMRASSFANCERALIAAATGMPGAGVPEKMLKRYNESAAVEDQVIDALHGRSIRWRDGEGVDFGVKVLDPLDLSAYAQLGGGISRVADDDQFTMELTLVEPTATLPRTVLRGHLDGIGRVYITGDMRFTIGDTLVIEAKAFGPDLWKKWLKGGIAALGDRYQYQCAAYAYAVGLDAPAPVLFVVGRKDGDGALLEVRMELIPEPLVKLSSFKGKARKVARAAMTGVVPDSCAQLDYPCPYYMLHDATAPSRPVLAADVVDLDAETDAKRLKLRDELVEVAAQWDALGVEERAAKAAREELKPRLLELWRDLSGDNDKALVTEGWEIVHVHADVEETTVTRKAHTLDYVKVKAR